MSVKNKIQALVTEAKIPGAPYVDGDPVSERSLKRHGRAAAFLAAASVATVIAFPGGGDKPKEPNRYSSDEPPREQVQPKNLDNRDTAEESSVQPVLDTVTEAEAGHTSVVEPVATAFESVVAATSETNQVSAPTVSETQDPQAQEILMGTDQGGYHGPPVSGTEQGGASYPKVPIAPAR